MERDPMKPKYNLQLFNMDIFLSREAWIHDCKAPIEIQGLVYAWLFDRTGVEAWIYEPKMRFLLLLKKCNKFDLRSYHEIDVITSNTCVVLLITQAIASRNDIMTVDQT